jgi:hypothetical protein
VAVITWEGVEVKIEVFNFLWLFNGCVFLIRKFSSKIPRKAVFRSSGSSTTALEALLTGVLFSQK